MSATDTESSRLRYYICLKDHSCHLPVHSHPWILWHPLAAEGVAVQVYPTWLVAHSPNNCLVQGCQLGGSLHAGFR